MNVEQLEIAKRRTEELLRFQKESDELNDFIVQVSEYKTLGITTSHQNELNWNGKKLFELVGTEIIDLLKKKLWERNDYIEKVTADDLLTDKE